MKKLISLGSYSSGHGNKNVGAPSTDKRVNGHDSLESGLNKNVGDKHTCGFQSPMGLCSKVREPVPDDQRSIGFTRSRSPSSKSFLGSELEQTYFSCSSNEKSSTSSSLQHQRSPLFRGQTLFPQKQHKANKSRILPTQNAHFLNKRPSSTTSSNLCSGRASIKIVDRYGNGEHKQESNVMKREINSSLNKTLNGSGGENLPPRAKHTRHTSPKVIVKEEQSSCTFEEGQFMCHNHVSRDRLDNDFRYEFPQRNEKNVVEQVSQSPLPKSKLENHSCGIPKSTEDICGRSVGKCSDLNLDADAQKDRMGNAYEIINEHNQVPDDYFGLEKKCSFLENSCKSNIYIDSNDSVDMDLGRSLKQAEKRIVLLSEELEQDCFLQNYETNVSALMQRIRNLTEEKMSLALEVSILIQSLITERFSVEKLLANAKSEHDLRTRMLEKERNMVLSTLEKELERRTYDWSSKLKKYQLEEQRLRDQVRELAEQNVSLQREASFHERDNESRSTFTHLEQQLKDLTARVREVCQENWNLQQNLCDIQEKYKAAEEDRECIRRNFNNKDEECKELHKSISKFLRVCSEQEKTMEGMREGFDEETEKRSTQEKFDKYVTELQMESIRLANIDLALCREVKTYRVEVDSLRRENVTLLNRLKISEKEGDALPVKLDKQMWTDISCLQNQGLSMLNESIYLCSKILDRFKERASEFSDSEQGEEVIKNIYQFIIESETKIQSLKQGSENLKTFSLTMSAFLHEKSEGRGADECRQNNDVSPEDMVRSELKTECSLSSLLREKIYPKAIELDQLQAHLANAIRGNDILRHEVQNAMDNLYRVTHKMLNQNENINKLQNSIQQSMDDLTATGDTLTKVTKERDLMSKEVERCTQNNMLLSSEIVVLKKQIEALEEDILVKEGQITILKDSMSNKSLDPFAYTNSSSSRDYFF